MKLINHIDYPSIVHGGWSEDDIWASVRDGRALPSGQFAIARSFGDRVLLARDPLGCNKLFFGRTECGELVVANRVAVVWNKGIRLELISSCPPGRVVSVSKSDTVELGGADISAVNPDTSVDLDEFQHRIRATLRGAISRLAENLGERRFVVCLSGGLDSSVIASLAAQHLNHAVAVSFSYLSLEDLQRYREGTSCEALGSASEDFKSAVEVAAALGIELLPVFRLRQDVGGAVVETVQACQDWRDFNVHCATVNLFIAQDVRAAYPDEEIVVLTGDLMNEFVCDYHDERVGDVVYYRTPSIPLAKRRRHFVRGLDAGDREIGVFWKYGLMTCQLFAAVADEYLRLPAAMLESEKSKWILNGALLPPHVATHVNKSKTRAQVGGSDLGTLGIYHELGIDDAQLRRIWRAQFPGETSRVCDRFIEFGRYQGPRYGVSR